MELFGFKSGSRIESGFLTLLSASKNGWVNPEYLSFHAAAYFRKLFNLKCRLNAQETTVNF